MKDGRMCEANGPQKRINLKDGRGVMVDECLADIIQALINGGIVTAYSCCGHGKRDGMILAYGKNGSARLFIVVEEGKKSLERFNDEFLEWTTEVQRRRQNAAKGQIPVL
jgi:hypothetical protein